MQGGRVVGELEQVAGGDAEYPSISENGQYISFTTNEGKSLAEITYGLGGESPETSRARRKRSTCTYATCRWLPRRKAPSSSASAQNGCDEPLIYREAETTGGRRCAAGRSAISADGNEVAFVTTAVSNLVNPAEVNTPALQVGGALRGKQRNQARQRESANGRSGVR